jgi:Ankyrin repeats (3 copies)
MAAKLRQWNTPTAELLRVAESGDVDEFMRLLPGVDDVNARNRHGMTALMKAAFFGHEPMVRVLLEHGANPNLTRNDRFTALALAAFFGHGETVKTLIEYGATTEAITRAGASAQTWAKARTFEEVARCLETHAPKPLRATPTPVWHPPTPVAVAPAEVKTLKDPPEIWDLVHEVPRSFNPRSAFISRITSMNRTFALSACVVVLMIVGGGVGFLMLRNSRVSSVPAEIPPAPIAAQTNVSSPPPAQAVVESPAVEVVNDNHSRTVPNRARLAIRQPRTDPAWSAPQAESAESKEATTVVTPLFESPKPAPPAAVKTDPNAGLSPRVIAPPKSAPPKGKVIQWP